MSIMKVTPSDARAFAKGWIGRNVEIGPFSCKDDGNYDVPIASFRAEAARAGFGEAQLEEAIGCAVPTFVTRAYADAASVWHSSKWKRADRHQ